MRGTLLLALVAFSISSWSQDTVLILLETDDWTSEAPNRVKALVDEWGNAASAELILFTDFNGQGLFSKKEERIYRMDKALESFLESEDFHFIQGRPLSSDRWLTDLATMADELQLFVADADLTVVLATLSQREHWKKHKEFLNALAVVYGRKDEEGALLTNDHWSIVHLNSNEIETLE